MFEEICYILLAILGLGLLIFIHEFAHYIVARRVKMKVEVFSIGFGWPIYSWSRNGVKWQIGCLPFGGFVKIAGMQKEGLKEPYEIEDGFFGKKPLDRIKVAVAGPFVNIAFALLLFILIWALGGRNKSFSEYTHLIGWMDKTSELYRNGIRPGDEIVEYGGREFTGFKDLLYAGAMEESETGIKGYRVDYYNKNKEPFAYKLKNYKSSQNFEEGFSTIGVLAPASYLIYDKWPDGKENLFKKGSPMFYSGIKYGDRIIWADGEIIFSNQELSNAVNTSSTLLTIQRGSKIFLTKVLRTKLEDLKVPNNFKSDLDDWQHEARIKDNLNDLFLIPYTFNSECIIEDRLDFIEEPPLLSVDAPFSTELKRGDRILAVDGYPLTSSTAILQKLQKRHVFLIVQHNCKIKSSDSWKEVDKNFADFKIEDLNSIISSIGTTGSKSSGDLSLLHPIVPKKFSELLPLIGREKEVYAYKREIEKIKNPEKKAEAIKIFETSAKKLQLGVALQNREVKYNPNPFIVFKEVFSEMWRILSSLVSGYLKPKWLSGPIGIVHMAEQSWQLGLKEALYWLAVISLNLGILNILPIPILDGGHILFSSVEMVTKKPLKSKTMEKIIIPFFVLLILAIVYVTYHDLLRLFKW